MWAVISMHTYTENITSHCTQEVISMHTYTENITSHRMWVVISMHSYAGSQVTVQLSATHTP